MVNELIHVLNSNKNCEISFSTSLNDVLPFVSEKDLYLGGYLSIPIDVIGNEYLVVFKKEVIKTVFWGGNPNNAIVRENDGDNYHPRNSFNV